MNGATEASKYMAVIAAELAGDARMSKDKRLPPPRTPALQSLYWALSSPACGPSCNQKSSYSSPKGPQIFKWDNNWLNTQHYDLSAK